MNTFFKLVPDRISAVTEKYILKNRYSYLDGLLNDYEIVSKLHKSDVNVTKSIDDILVHYKNFDMSDDRQFKQALEQLSKERKLLQSSNIMLEANPSVD